MPVVGGAEGVDLSSAMTSALTAVENAGPNILDRPPFPGWYSDIYSEVKDTMGALLTGRASAEEFIERVQEASDEVREDPDIVKFKRA